MSKVAMIGKMVCQEGKGEEMEAALAAMVDATADEEGCEIYSYHRGENNEYWFFALMSSQDALEAHGQGEAMKAAMGAAFPLLVGRPEMSPVAPVAAKGLDL